VAISGKRTPADGRWWEGITRYQWLVLAVAAAGWLFDTMDGNLFNLVRQVAVADLLRPLIPAAKLAPATTQYGGIATAIFLLGWSAGGYGFGILGDRIGRAQTMVLTILTYALFTGLSGLARTWEQLAAFRFLTGLGVGGEWAAGAAIVAEVFPARSRPMALGMLQALSAIGNMMAAIVSLGLAGVSWRWVFAVGALPALMVVWVRRSIKEPESWHQARAAAAAGAGKPLGAFADLFRDPILRRNTIAGTLMAIAGVGGLWGAAFWTPELVQSVLRHLPKEQQRYDASASFLVQQIGAGAGMVAFAAFTERTSRRFAFFVSFLLSFLAIQGMFRYTHSFRDALIWSPILGFCTLGPFCGYTVYFPELFPTRLRATGCGFCYNGGRALAALAPFALGGLARRLGGIAPAVSIVSCIYLLGLIALLFAPETRGQPLPD
jgi:predicted MFS family arabinose efflux permease